MMLPIELANWQWGYVILSIMGCCFLIIAMIQILGGNEPRYNAVVKYGFILFCVGIASILMNIKIIEISVDSFGGGLLAQSMALVFSIAMATWIISVAMTAMYFANRLKIFEVESLVQLYLALLPIIAIIILIMRFVNNDMHNESVALLRETLFGVIPVITLTSCTISMLARKIVEK